jgi:hypothetical protein
VEYFNFRTWKWDVFNAKLTIARHGAAAVEVNGSIYIVGGHTVDLPDQFINSIERYTVKKNMSCFEILDVKFMQRDIRMQSQLVLPIADENGLLIVGYQE